MKWSDLMFRQKLAAQISNTLNDLVEWKMVQQPAYCMEWNGMFRQSMQHTSAILTWFTKEAKGAAYTIRVCFVVKKRTHLFRHTLGSPLSEIGSLVFVRVLSQPASQLFVCV
jgi:hypothetical protein